MQRILRWSLLVLGLWAAAPLASAQEEEAALREQYAEKLHKDFVGKIPWIQSFEQARATAKQQEKLVLGYFSRSYAP
jgi:hypothetical protein